MIEPESKVDKLAWISVHDSIDGPKLRDLYKKIGTSKFEATGILICLWQWGLQNADENGALLHADRDDVERHLYSMSAGCKADVKDIFDALLETGWIDERNGQLFLHDWSVWQKEWYKYQSRRKKDVERKRATAALTSEEEKEESEKAREPEKKPEKASVKEEKPKQTEKKKKSTVDYSEEFQKLWEIYPRTDRKAEAYECFTARLKDGVPAGNMIAAATAYAAKCKRDKTDAKYIMMAKTFLGPHLNFMDYVPKNPKPTETANSQNRNPFEQFVEE